jgi:hypothetical protein
MQIAKYSSLAVLILANLFILMQYYLFNWDSGQVLLLFWIESAIVGLYTIFKMVVVKFRIKNIKMPPLLFIIPFFIVHFGGFMVGHLLFIILGFMENFSLGILLALLASSTPLFISHGFSFVSNFLMKKEYGSLKFGNIMLMPYKRIVIMHLTLILGVALNIPIIFLFAAKIAADAFSHTKEHGMFIEEVPKK